MVDPQKGQEETQGQGGKNERNQESERNEAEKVGRRAREGGELHRREHPRGVRHADHLPEVPRGRAEKMDQSSKVDERNQRRNCCEELKEDL